MSENETESESDEEEEGELAEPQKLQHSQGQSNSDNVNRNALCDSRASTATNMPDNDLFNSSDVISFRKEETENKIDPEEEAFFHRFQQFMTKQGWMSATEDKGKAKSVPTKGKSIKKGMCSTDKNGTCCESNSELTIYKEAVPEGSVGK